jgi:hypothetical protein
VCVKQFDLDPGATAKTVGPGAALAAFCSAELGVRTCRQNESLDRPRLSKEANEFGLGLDVA